MPDWGRRCDIGRRRMTAYAILFDILDDAEWANQLAWEFGEKVIEKLPTAKWQISAGEIYNCITSMELGLKFELRHR
jgi:hypothetical protein